MVRSTMMGLKTSLRSRLRLNRRSPAHEMRAVAYERERVRVASGCRNLESEYRNICVSESYFSEAMAGFFYPVGQFSCFSDSEIGRVKT